MVFVYEISTFGCVIYLSTVRLRFIYILFSVYDLTPPINEMNASSSTFRSSYLDETLPQILYLVALYRRILDLLCLPTEGGRERLEQSSPMFLEKQSPQGVIPLIPLLCDFPEH